MSKSPGITRNDADQAVGELLRELERTRKEHSKVLLQLNQLENSVQTLRALDTEKDATIARLEKELATKAEEHRLAMQESEERYITKDAALAHRARHLELEVQRLQSDNEMMVKLEADNRTLRETILDNQAAIEQLQRVNEDLRRRTRDGGAQSYEELANEFQMKLAAAEKRFRAEAYRALSEEAKIALQGNDHLQMVLERQNDSIETVLARCKQLEQARGQLQEEQDRNAEELQHHVAEIRRLTKSLEDTRNRNKQLDEAMKQRRVERASLELLFIEYEATRKKLDKAEERARRAKREAERWQSRAVQLTEELSEEQREVAERKLLQLQAMSSNIEENALREEARSAVRARARIRQSEGAAALQLATGHTRFSEVLSSTDGLPTKNDDIALKSRPSVDPMELLSMWNIKHLENDPAAEFGNNNNNHKGIPDALPRQMNSQQQQQGEGVQEGQPVPLNPVRPPPAVANNLVHSGHTRQQPKTVAEQVAAQNKALSVLSQTDRRNGPPKALPFAARYRPPSRGSSGSSSTRQPLHTVTASGDVVLMAAKVSPASAPPMSKTTLSTGHVIVP